MHWGAFAAGEQPAGPYKGPCTNCTWAKDTLTCECKDGAAKPHSATLPRWSKCRWDIRYEDGVLTCAPPHGCRTGWAGTWHFLRRDNNCSPEPSTSHRAAAMWQRRGGSTLMGAPPAMFGPAVASPSKAGSKSRWDTQRSANGSFPKAANPVIVQDRRPGDRIRWSSPPTARRRTPQRGFSTSPPLRPPRSGPGSRRRSPCRHLHLAYRATSAQSASSAASSRVATGRSWRRIIRANAITQGASMDTPKQGFRVRRGRARVKDRVVRALQIRVAAQGFNAAMAEHMGTCAHDHWNKNTEAISTRRGNASLNARAANGRG